MPETQIAMPASAAPAPGSAALLDHALACPSTCPVCGESVGRTPALCCAQCTCGRLRLACALPGGKTSRCPQCAQPATLRFKGSVTPAAAGPRESVVLTRARGAAAEEAEAASGGGASGKGGGERGRCGHGKQRGKCRECREERADGNTAGQQANDAAEQGEARGGEGRGRKRQRESAPQRGRKKCEHNRQRYTYRLRGHRHLRA
jgi:hypothetical protein